MGWLRTGSGSRTFLRAGVAQSCLKGHLWRWADGPVGSMPFGEVASGAASTLQEPFGAASRSPRPMARSATAASYAFLGLGVLEAAPKASSSVNAALDPDVLETG